MKRVRKTIDCGDVRYISNYIAPMYGNHRSRSRWSDESRAAVKKVNEVHAVDYVEAMLNTNFSPHDWHLACTYDDEHYNNVDEDRAFKDRRNFYNKLKRRCAKRGIEIKYLTMTEQGVRSNRWHHHFVLPQGIPIALMYECWTFGKIRILNTLYKNGDFRGLAQYFVDKTKGGQKENDRPRFGHRYSFSRNCKKPIVTYETDLSNKWIDTPRPPAGWRLIPDSLYNGIDSWGGNKYQKYTLVRDVRDCAKRIERAINGKPPAPFVDDKKTAISKSTVKGVKKMPCSKALTEEVRLKIYDDYCNGKYKSQIEAADKNGVNVRTIQRYFAEIRAALPPQKREKKKE